MMMKTNLIITASVLIVVAALAATIPSIKADVLVGCSGNSHDRDNPTGSGNPHDSGEAGNPHDVGGGHNLHETDACPGS
jgi:hypothetical protein